MPVAHPGTGAVEATQVLGSLLRDVVRDDADRFRLFSPDENDSNRLQDVLEVTDRAWNAETHEYDDHPRPGRSSDGDPFRAHLSGWLEGYF